MVQTQIQLFLNTAGRKAFPGWLRFFGKVARQFKGFVNIQLLQVEGSSSLGLVLIFDNKASQNAFLESPVFSQLMARMQSHSVKPYRKVVLRAKNLYNYKAKKSLQPRPEEAQVPSSAPVQQKLVQQKLIKQYSAKKHQAEQIQQAEADRQITLQDDNVVGMAEFMSMRKQS